MTPRTSSEEARSDPRASTSTASLPGTDEEGPVGERSPMLGRWQETPHGDEDGEDDEGDEDELLRLEDGDEEADDGLVGSSGGMSGEGGIPGQWESSWGEEGFVSRGSASTSPGWGDTHMTRGQRRRVYGGGRADLSGGGLSAGEVAGLLLAGTLGPTPLLLSHAAALLGLPLFLPLLFVTALLSWFAYLVLGVEARYVGARSWPSLTSAVFPHRLKTHRLGEFLASCLVLFMSGARGVVGVVAASEVVVDLLVPAGGRRWSERIIGIAVISGLWAVVPLAIMPFIRPSTNPRRSAVGSSKSIVSRSASWITFMFWPLALLILGVRLRTLNDLPATRPPQAPPSQREVMGLSIWGGISLIVFALSAHQDTFMYLTSLARPSSTASRRQNSRRASLPSINISSPNPSDPSAAREGRRNQWPLATALGVAGSTLIQMGWGLVGYLGIDGGGQEGNLFASDRLPRGDFWLIIVRGLVLVAIVVGFEGSLQTAYGRTRKALALVFGSGDPTPQPGSERRNSKARYVKLGLSEDAQASSGWRAALARLLVWGAVATVSIVVTAGGEDGEGLVSVAEIAGCIGGSLLGFFIPAVFFIALFHLRRPRSIFVSDPSATVFATDTLLMRKEREVQRRLSGRRIWQDILVFGGLLPFGTVVLLRGITALIVKED